MKRLLPLIVKITIALVALWCILALVLFWHSGTKETQQALLSGKRFIVSLADGKVEGLVVTAPGKKEEEAKAEDASIPPPAAEPEKADASAVTSVTTSANPIADINEALIDKASGVSLPKVSAEGQRPEQYYAKTYRRQNELPIIAILITGLGQAKKVTDMALALDDRISLSFSPYSPVAGSWAAASRLTGHEFYVDLPMQTADHPDADPGPYSILLTKNTTENVKNLHWALSRFQGYVGVATPITEVITGDSDTFTPIAKELSNRGVSMVVGHIAPQVQEVNDDGSTKKPGHDLKPDHADIWIDEELTEMSIQARLATLEQIAQRQGYAIGIAQAYPLSIEQIKVWQRTMGERGVMLAPVSFVAKLKP